MTTALKENIKSNLKHQSREHLISLEGEKSVSLYHNLLELQERISELNGKMASLELELEKLTLSAKFILLKVLCSVFLFVGGFFLIQYCVISLPLSIESFLALATFVFSVFAFILVAIWKI